MIEIQQLSVRFGSQHVLQNLSMEVRTGEIFGLLGPSGAGKTTLIRILTGALKAGSGSVTIGETTVPSFSLLRRIGFMPQNDAVYPEISGYDNLHFFGGLFGLRGNALRAAIVKNLDLVDLGSDANKLVANYSGGMRKRLSLAAALLHDPDCLILDEPTVGIDPLLRRRIWEEFSRQRAAGKTLVVSTHVMDEIRYCDRAGLLYNGGLLACDTVDNLVTLGHGSIENLFFDASLQKKEGTSCAI